MTFPVNVVTPTNVALPLTFNLSVGLTTPIPKFPLFDNVIKALLVLCIQLKLPVPLTNELILPSP